MNRPIALLVIGLIFGGGIGFTIAAGAGVTLDGHDHSEHLTGGVDHAATGHDVGADHDHSKLTVLPAGAEASLSIRAIPDTSAGYNIQLTTTEFRFAPESVGAAHMPGEGHAHIYVNGEKRGRVYGEWYHLDSVPDGDVTVRVTLNSNDHSQLAVEDKPIEAQLILPN